jgi:hypothetical protein
VQPLDAQTDHLYACASDYLEFDTPVPFRENGKYFESILMKEDGNTCAVTGLCLLNGGGRPEVQAAHIRAVEANGPDTVRNGLALTATVHWMFDRGLIFRGRLAPLAHADWHIGALTPDSAAEAAALQY